MGTSGSRPLRRLQDHPPSRTRIDVDAQLLYTENRAQTLVVLTTRPGTESHSKLELLSVIGHQQLTP
ncbi:hypothetical protein [Streptomyces doebereineriae]|uniref:hypothetical protein n=1 Tax=Streptomyces doebereineriae TaxID=3075528 RepID=UPI00374E0C11